MRMLLAIAIAATLSRAECPQEHREPPTEEPANPPALWQAPGET